MTKQLVITTQVSVTGDMSPDDARRILESIEAGAIDLPQLQLLKSEFQPHGAPWRFMIAVTGAAIVAEGVTP